jgi:hypothetical protein
LLEEFGCGGVRAHWKTGECTLLIFNEKKNELYSVQWSGTPIQLILNSEVKEVRGYHAEAWRCGG